MATVNINNAIVKDFTSLKGIGTKKAEVIIKYRNSVKCFKNIDELTNIKGIGNKIICKNKNDLQLRKCVK